MCKYHWPLDTHYYLQHWSHYISSLLPYFCRQLWKNKSISRGVNTAANNANLRNGSAPRNTWGCFHKAQFHISSARLVLVMWRCKLKLLMGNGVQKLRRISSGTRPSLAHSGVVFGSELSHPLTREVKNGDPVQKCICGNKNSGQCESSWNFWISGRIPTLFPQRCTTLNRHCTETSAVYLLTFLLSIQI